MEQSISIVVHRNLAALALHGLAAAGRRIHLGRGMEADVALDITLIGTSSTHQRRAAALVAAAAASSDRYIPMTTLLLSKPSVSL